MSTGPITHQLPRLVTATGPDRANQGLSPPANYDSVKSSKEFAHSVIKEAYTEFRNMWLVLQSNAARYTDALIESTGRSDVNSSQMLETHFANHRALYELSVKLLQQLDLLTPFLSPLSQSNATETQLANALTDRLRLEPEYMLNESFQRLMNLLEKSLVAGGTDDPNVLSAFRNAAKEANNLHLLMKDLIATEQQLTRKLTGVGQSERGRTIVEPLIFHNPALYQFVSDNMERVRASGDSPEAALKGLTLAPHPPDRIRGFVENGARIVTYSTETLPVAAHCIYFPPDAAARQNRSYVEQLELYAPVGFIHAIHVNSELGGQQAYQKVLTAVMTGLQYSDAKHVAGGVHENNWRGVTTHLAVGKASLIGSAGYTIGDQRFLSCVLPISPSARSEHLSSPLPSRAMAQAVKRRELAGFFPQQWQTSAEAWLKNYRICSLIKSQIDSVNSAPLGIRLQRELQKARFEMSGFETRVKMVEGGRELLHLLRTEQPVPGEVWKQVQSGKLANQGQDINRNQMIRVLDDARDPSLVRITGGCGLLEESHWKGMVRLFQRGFDGFGGAMLVGGTRMLVQHEGHLTSTIRPGITEIPLALKPICPEAVIGGLVPGSERFSDRDKTILYDQSSWLLGEKNKTKRSFYTILNPEIEYFLYLNEESFGAGQRWDAEYHEAIQIAKIMSAGERQGGRTFNPALVVYNGGETTKREINAWCDLSWPVVLIRESGRAADELASDSNFLKSHSNVSVVNKNGQELNERLRELGIIPSL
jgi:hypothetical protein